MVEKLKGNKTKVKEIEVFTNSNSKIEEIIVPKSKTDIEPLSDDEEDYLNYLINRYVTNEQTSLDS